MSKGTIVYIGGFELPDRNAAAQRVISNSKLLRAIGYDVVLIGVHKGAENEIEENVFFGFKSISFRYPNSQKEWLKYIVEFKFYRKIIEANQKVHSIIFYNLPAFSMARLLKYSNNKNIKTFSDCTEWYETSKKLTIKAIIKDLDVKLRMQYYHKRVTGVISISKYLNDYYENLKVNTFMLPPLVDLNDDKWKIMNHDTSSQGLLKFVYVGSPFNVNDKTTGKTVKDRIDLVIDSLYKCFLRGERFVFNIVGITKDNFLDTYPTLENKINEMEKLVTFKGRLTHFESIAVLNNSDYSIFFRENTLVNNAGFPTKLVEAITASTAVITNNSSNIDDYLIDGKNGFILNSKSIDSNEIDDLMNKVFGLDKSGQLNIEKYTKEHNDVFDYRKYISAVSNFIEG